jgi:hypothetical protein
MSVASSSAQGEAGLPMPSRNWVPQSREVLAAMIAYLTQEDPEFHGPSERQNG